MEYSSISTAEDVRQLELITRQCFNSSASGWESFANTIGLENFRCVRQAGRVVGVLGIYQIGQWFGGSSLPMAGVAGVGVAPEARGTGVVTKLLTETLKELYGLGVPVSALYPATQRPYRKVGYEQAGTHVSFQIDTDKIGNLNDRQFPMQQVDAANHEVFHPLYRQAAIANNGHLDRNLAMWQRLVETKTEEVIYAYLVGSDSQPEGYIIYQQQREQQKLQLFVRDWVALTPAAGRRLWTFLGDCRSIIKEVLWRGSALDPLLSLLPEQTYNVRDLARWMLRVVNVELALSSRGYPAGVEAELHLEIRDDLLIENSDRFILKVSGGRGEVTRGGRGDLQLDARGLAPLYTGLFAPQQLQLIDRLTASEEALSAAAQIFAGSEPWMPDFF
ncbi:MAG: GNAT family N-acetyltransferase [Cyanosarcina radialis HA8281-LM2]|jgi:predicted acetyltransferase|nr:GNAT family N-acetyltransferase [Cyanosarcina radialis HA8281-LM2]